VEPRQLILWLPPQFDPENGSEAGNLFSQRLDEFVARRPQTELQVRVKSLSGEFGLLESLQLTGSTAPLLMPDLVAMPRSLLEDAYRYDLVVPLDEILEDFSEEDWYSYALDLARVEDQTAGIPFAGDLMVLAYKENGELPPADWNSLLNLQRALSFPASDPSGLVTLAWYQSLGGELRTEDGEPGLEEDLMLEVLNFYEQAQDVNLMPYWLTQFENGEQSWTSYMERQSTLSITWTSQLIGSESPNTILAAMPTKDARAFTYADGWVWVVVPSDSETEEFALELADYLTESDFLSAWSYAGGYLPVRQASLSSWAETPYLSTLEKLLPAAILVPEGDLVSEIGPGIRDAVVEVLKSQVDPQEALETSLGDLLE
jgi:ABC-type glycerol-3-phosphate transport system substrate-binding protein